MSSDSSDQPRRGSYRDWFSLCGLVASVLVWSSIWFIVENLFRGLPRSQQIQGHFVVLLIGLCLAYHVVRGGGIDL
jgi:hypothetical protein